MILSITTFFQNSLIKANQWFLTTPERALDHAYKAALMIKSIEDEHFRGRKISANSVEYGDSVMAYFEAELNKHLNIAKVRLAEFNISRSISNISTQKNLNLPADKPENYSKDYSLYKVEQPSIILEKLSFIDKIIEKYSINNDRALAVVPQPELFTESDDRIEKNRLTSEENVYTNNNNQTVADKTGILPRSILGTISRIQRDLDPESEEDIVRKFRKSKRRTLISIKFILALILVPLLTQQLTKTFLVGPIVDKLEEKNKSAIFLNINLEEEALMELERFEKKLEFKSLIGIAPEISKQEKEEKIKDKAMELAEEFRDKSTDAVKNVFADILSLIAFAVVILVSKKEILILKYFIDDIVYGLSDSAKAFIIILFTDVFVGFHSPHGWEVILSGISRHLGLPENHDFIFLFIATFPVILDTMFKYWIFRYLNRLSPSAVATYKNMNE